MKLAIIFVGLIIHVNQPWSLTNTAVLPNADQHVSQMWIPSAALSADDRAFLKCSTDPCVVNLEKIRVTVGGTRGVFSSETDELNAALPHLETVSQCRRTLKEEIRHPKGGNDSFAFVEYTGGARSTEAYFAKKIVFPTVAEPGKEAVAFCATCKLRYEADTRGAATLTFDDGTRSKTFTIASGATLQVWHVPCDTEELKGVGPASSPTTGEPTKDLRCDSSPHTIAGVNSGHSEPPDHFRYVYTIFEPSTKCETPKPIDKEACDNPKLCPVPAYNSRNPDPVPYPGDCGQTGFP